jgi:hypothetical protein
MSASRAFAVIRAVYGYPRHGVLRDMGSKPVAPIRAGVFVNAGRYKTKGAWGGLLVACALTLSVFTAAAPPVHAAPASSADLERMEQKFFQHSYPKDELSARLERLEKMVFGETKTGSDDARLAKLVEAIPASSPGENAGGSDTASSGSADDVAAAPRKPPARAPKQQPTPPPSNDDTDTADRPAPGDEKYPAVTAIEQKVLGRDYPQDPVNQRLARLETKVFGKPSTTTDLSDRVDALKGRTGIDITRQHPRGSDWSDEDDDDSTTPSSPPVARNRNNNGGSYGSSPGADGMSFSGRNMRQDMNQAFGSNAGSGAGSGSYGFGGSGLGMGAGLINPSSPSGSYGGAGNQTYGAGSPSYGGGNQNYGAANPSYGAGNQAYGNPGANRAPTYRPSAPPAMADGSGITQQVTALESSVFGKTYHDPLPDRLSRLEATVFPQEKPADDQTLPERVSRLASIIPINTNQNRRVAQRPDDYTDPDATSAQQQAQRQKNNGGLSKIINSLSGMFGGGMGGGMGGMGGGMTGGYPMQGGALATDPQTGMLIDPSSGNLIDPNTGAVVGRRTTGNYGGYSSPYGAGMGTGGMSGFNNGFSPYGMSPYGGGYNRGGMGIGIGGMGGGGGRGFGFWP